MTPGWVWRCEAAFGALSVAVGVALLFGETPLSADYYQSIRAAFYDGFPMPAAAARLTDWLLATCGAGVIGWGIAWIYLALGPLRRGEAWARRCLALSLVAWVVADLAAALRYGVSGEIVFVVGALLAAGLPLVFARGDQAA